MRITDIAIRALPPPSTGAKIHHDDSLSGFGVRVTSTGVKAFVLTFGVSRERITIGRYPIISLQEARAEARRLLAEQTLGKTRPRHVTLLETVETYYRTHAAQLRPGTQREIKRLFTRFLPKRGNLDDVTLPALTKILDGITSPSEAEHFHRAAKTFFKWCVERGLIPASPIERLRAPSRWKSRERILTDEELRAVWTAAGQSTEPLSTIVRLLVLTGQRRGEIGGLRKAWLDLEAGTCAFPAETTKNKRRHAFPLGLLSQSLLGTYSALDNDMLFQARGSDDIPKPYNGWSKGKAALDKKANIAPWTLHDLRRTYATNLQKLGIKLEVIEALLNHVSGTRTGIVGVYQRHRYEAEMREAVALFDAWFSRVITGK